MIRRLTFIIATLLISWSISAKTYEVTSPDGSLKTEVSVADGKVVYSVMKDGKEMISPSLIGMQLADGTSYDGSVRFVKADLSSMDRVLEAKFYKKSQTQKQLRIRKHLIPK